MNTKLEFNGRKNLQLIRVSSQVYNSMDDIEKLKKALVEIRDKKMFLE